MTTRIPIVTGASQGIVKAIALVLLNDGYKVEFNVCLHIFSVTFIIIVLDAHGNVSCKEKPHLSPSCSS